MTLVTILKGHIRVNDEGSYIHNDMQIRLHIEIRIFQYDVSYSYIITSSCFIHLVKVICSYRHKVVW